MPAPAASGRSRPAPTSACAAGGAAGATPPDRAAPQQAADGVTVRVAVDAPGLPALDYAAPAPLPAGTVVRAPLGRQTVVGVVLGAAESAAPTERGNDGEPPTAAQSIALRPLQAVFDALPPLPADWLDTVRFTAAYYQRAVGEVIGAALPALLRAGKPEAVAAACAALAPPPRFRATAAGGQALAALPPRHAALRRLAAAVCSGGVTLAQARALHPQAGAVLRRWQQQGWVEAVTADAADAGAPLPPLPADVAVRGAADVPPSLHPEQAAALQAIVTAEGFAPFLLFGVTGSGKTEVYLHAAAAVLARDAQAQVLVLTPEINLTPQLLERFAARFGPQQLAVLHSGLAEGQRGRNWLAAHLGHARIVLGTRLAVLASLPRLRAIFVDEEHDPSYKQQEGARYSARDLAVWRAHRLQIPVVLGSATPSLESWRAAQTGRYRLLTLRQRASGRLPVVRLVDANRDPALREGRLIGAELDAAIRERLARGEQSLLFLNRRGYAPVLRCPDCGWLSDCPHCDAHLVFHRTDRSLRCHHCGYSQRVPRACPQCGSLDLQPVGRGTQRVEEALAEQYPQARIARIDADTTRRKGAAQGRLASVHAGEVDLLVGTQMVTKGHDFQRVTLVAALNPDAGLFTLDPRGPERLFAQLMQAAGRAGRARAASEPLMLVQTAYPAHPLYAALAAQDYERFASAELAERQRAGMPPFTHQALLRAEHRQPERVADFLAAALQAARELVQAGGAPESVVPAERAALGGRGVLHRQQMLVESASRPALQAFLGRWRQQLQALPGPRLRWAIDVDPLEY